MIYYHIILYPITLPRRPGFAPRKALELGSPTGTGMAERHSHEVSKVLLLVLNNRQTKIESSKQTHLAEVRGTPSTMPRACALCFPRCSLRSLTPLDLLQPHHSPYDPIRFPNPHPAMA